MYKLYVSFVLASGLFTRVSYLKMKKTKNKSIAFVAPNTRSIFTFRKELIISMLHKGWEVHIVSDADQFVERVIALGVKFHAINMSRFMSPLVDLKYIANLCTIFKKNKFEIIHTFTVKPNVYGSIANLISSRSKLVALVEGFGFLYGYDNTFKTRFKRSIYFALNKMAFRFAHKVWFINKDDQAEMISRRIIKKEKCVYIKSIGVNLAQFSANNVDRDYISQLKKRLNINENSVVITLVSRLNILKGIREFIEAARILEQKNTNLVFLIVGEIQEDSPYTMTQEEMKELPSNTTWIGFTEHINEINFLTDIACLPSYYREGVPRSLIEAMAFGKPLIVSDSVGCREIVVEGENGYLVPIKDSKLLADRINRLANNKALREAFGQKSRLMCEKELDVNFVNEQVISELYGL